MAKLIFLKIKFRTRAIFLIALCVFLCPCAVWLNASRGSCSDAEKDCWPMIAKPDLNVALIGTYGEYRYPGHYHLAIDIHSHKGEPVFNNRDGVLLECIKIHNRAGYRIVIGDPDTLEGREFTHVDPDRKILNLTPGKSFVKKGELLGTIADYRNDGDNWNDHLHYAYVRIEKTRNIEGNALNVLEGIENPLNRLEITPEIQAILRDAPPQIAEPIFFIPDEGEKGGFKNGPVYGDVDIVAHAFDRMGRSWGLGKYSPAPYEFEWRIIDPPGYEAAGGSLRMDGTIPLVRPPFHPNYIENELWAGDFQIIVTNGMTENGFWRTMESKSNPGYDTRDEADAKYPDGTYTIELIIREHPALGIPQRESRFTAKAIVDNFIN